MSEDQTKPSGTPVRAAATAALRFLLCALLFLTAFSLRRAGSDWPNLHPDSKKMTRWMQWTLHRPYVRDQVYPGGFFTLFRPVQRLAVQRRLPRIAPDPANRPPGAAARAAVERDLDVIALARAFNAGLGALTCVTLLLLAWSLTGSFAAGWAAGLFAALDPWHIEHCHYAETDIAMVFTLSLALLLWAWAGKRNGAVPFAAAALASGFAAGTKYPLLLLIALVAACAWRRPEDGAWRWGRASRRTLLGLLFFALGFVWANPATLLDPRWFFEGLRADAAGVLSETQGVIGEAYGRPFARVAHQARWGLLFLLAHGWAWIATTLVGTGFLLTRRFRAAWRVTFLFPLVHAAYLIALAPWIRMQETLVFMPWASCAAGAAALAAIEWARPAGRRRRARCALVAGLALAVGADLSVRSARRSNLFTRVDTRHDAEAWLRSHLPRGETVGLEIYTKSRPGHPVPVREIVALSKIEQQGVDAARARGCAYLLRNETMPDRGAFDPFTGALYPGFERNRRAFLAASERLAAWSPIDPENAVTFAFCNSELALYGLRRGAESVAFDAPLTRPVHFGGGASAVYPAGRLLGSGTGLAPRRETQTLRVGGPDVPRDGIYLILHDLGRGARVRIRGFGRRLRVDLARGERRAVHLVRGRLLPGVERFERIRVSADGDGMCLAQAVFDPWEAAAVLIESGAPREALRLLDRHPADRASDALLRLLATPDMEGPPAGTDLARVREAHARWTAAMEQPSAQWRVNGVAGRSYDEFARLYLGGRDEARDGPPEDRVLLPPGRWLFRAETRADAQSPWRRIEKEILCARPMWLHDAVAGWRGKPGVLVRNAEIRWTLRDRLADLNARVEQALEERE